MSNFIINKIDSFSFDESYNATHGYVNEFSELEKSIIPQVNPIAPNANLIPLHTNPIVPVQNNINNNPNDELNRLYQNIATLISKHFAQKNVQSPNNINGQNNGQVNSNVPVQDSNQINNEPTVRIKHILLNQLLQLYDPPKQNKLPGGRPKARRRKQLSNNRQNAQQQNQPLNNQQNAQQQNQPPNNQNCDLANLRMKSSIQDEINSNLKELITINKLQSLINIFLSNELTELINSNKEQREYNKEQREYNKTLGKSLKETLLYLKDNKDSQNSNNN